MKNYLRFAIRNFMTWNTKMVIQHDIAFMIFNTRLMITKSCFDISCCHACILHTTLVTCYQIYNIIQHLSHVIKYITFLAATKQLYDWFSPCVGPSVCLSVRPSHLFLLCSHHRIIMKFSGVLINDKSDVHAKGQGQRSRSQRSTPNLTVSGL